jgi:DNA-binding response OmpR family regulator
MPSDTKQIEDVLHDRRILIVEDKEVLARALATLFEKYTGSEPVISHCVEEAHKAVAESQDGFDLAIVDAMLPHTYKQLEAIREHELALKHVRDTIKELNSFPQSESAKNELGDIRNKRVQALKQIADLIDPRAGIDLVQDWRKQGQIFAVLYLTARGNEEIIQEGITAAGKHSSWIVKPSTDEEILQICVRLIVDSQSQAREDKP